MNVDLSIMHLIAQASLLVQMVMLTLLVASVVSWTVIFKKQKVYEAAEKTLQETERMLQDAEWGKFNEWLLSQRAESGIIGVLRGGLRESMRFATTRLPSGARVTALKQVMDNYLTRDAHDLEKGVPFLATVGSVSPYVGLFGTVWGIMMAFQALGMSTAQATLAMVAPGIAEALIATAMGLFAAIPAVVAYNRFNSRTQRLLERADVSIAQFCHLYWRYLETSEEELDTPETRKVS